MREYVSSKGTTGISVQYKVGYSMIYVYKSGRAIYAITGSEVPAHILSSTDNDEVFEWVTENYSTQIDERLTELGL